MGPDLALALQLADAADALALRRFRAADLRVETKPDLTPVTEADRAVEAELRARLAAARPEDAVLGEEEGRGGAAGAVRRWLLDPIDGTRNYSRGVPVWATLIALEDGDGLAVGVVSAPALGRRWWAERGGGTWRDDGGPLRVSAVARLEDAVVCVPLAEPAAELRARAWHARGFGDFWAHMLVAEGAAEAAVDEVGVSEWDLAAVRIVVEEAGGRFTDRAGAARIDGRSAVSTNGLLHDAVLAAVGET